MNAAKWFLSFPAAIARYRAIVDYSGYGSMSSSRADFIYRSINMFSMFVGGYLDQAPEERRKWQQVGFKHLVSILRLKDISIAPRQIEGEFDHIVVVD